VADPVEFSQRLWGKARDETTLDHRPAGNSPQVLRCVPLPVLFIEALSFPQDRSGLRTSYLRPRRE